MNLKTLVMLFSSKASEHNIPLHSNAMNVISLRPPNIKSCLLLDLPSKTSHISPDTVCVKNENVKQLLNKRFIRSRLCYKFADHLGKTLNHFATLLAE